MAGDFSKPTPERPYYYFGSTLTDLAYDMIKTAAPYDIKPGADNFTVPADQVNVAVDLIGFIGEGEKNYPLQVGLELVNNSNVDLSGAVIEFNLSPATPLHSNEIQFIMPFEGPEYPVYNDPNAVDIRAGVKYSATVAGGQRGNVGGLPDGFHRYKFTLDASSWAKPDFGPGKRVVIPFRVFMPIVVPTNFTFKVGGKTYGRIQEVRGAVVEDNVTTPGGNTGNPDTPNATCEGLKEWSASDSWTTYTVGDRRTYNGKVYQVTAVSWTESAPATANGSYSWKEVAC